jgi:hypothetical protein
MAITEVYPKIALRLSATKSNGSSCGLPEASIWVPVAPTVTSLPPAPAVVVNENPVPAESAILPEDFDYDNPNLCQIFDEILSNVQSEPVYAKETTVTNLILPYNERVSYLARLQIPLNLFRYNYTLKPRISDVNITTKTKTTGVRLYKFKCEKLAVSLVGVDAIIYPVRRLVAATGSFTLGLNNATIIPAKLFADKGSIVTVFAAASISVPGTFSYGWSSTSATTAGSASPIGIGYRRNIHQSLYSAAILSANGARPGVNFKNLRWYVTSAINPTYSILGMNIRLFHCSAVNTDSELTPVSGQTKTNVYSDSVTTEFTKAETVGVLTIPFSSTFQWDGINSIVVESCTTQNQTTYQQQGALRRIATGSINVRRHMWTDDVGSSCNDQAFYTYTDQISIEMDFV